MEAAKISDSNKHPRAYMYFLCFTAFACGSMVMVVEVLGSRVIGPFFGVSLFVWTSLISVAMISLALGYAIGGALSDRYDSADYLYGFISLAGIFVIIIPLIKSPVLKLSMALGLRAGAFVSSLALFGPSLILLGCVSPYLIKIVAREVSNIGQTVGSFYALSTIGSVFGTIITGFFLIAYVSVSNIFFLVGSLLILTAAFYFVFFRGYKAFALILVVLTGFPFLADKQVIAKQMSNGTMVRLIDQKNSYYGDIRVIDYSYGSRHQRELTIDGLIQGGVDMVSGLSVYSYPYLLSYLPMEISPEGERALVIGLGAGIIPRTFEQEGVITDIVDIDEDVVAMSQKHFGPRIQGQTIIEDARYFLGHNQQEYDYIILDVFNGDTTPSHVVSLEAFKLMHDNLKAGGVLGINIVSRLEYTSASVARTLKEIFDNVEVYPLFAPLKDGEGNIAIFAYNGPHVTLDKTIFESIPIHPSAAEEVHNFTKNYYSFAKNASSTILKDDFNPMDCYDINLKESVRLSIIKDTDWDILLN